VVKTSSDNAIDHKIWNDLTRLREWTFERLQQLDLNQDPERERDLYADPKRSLHALYLAEERKNDEGIRKPLVRLKKNRPDEYDELISRDPGLVGFARPSRGRPRGQADEVVAAWREVQLIVQLWKNAFGRSYRKGEEFPLSYEIAAERFGIKPEAIDNYRKNSPSRGGDLKRLK
jgi:hypothetical protein